MAEQIKGGLVSGKAGNGKPHDWQRAMVYKTTAQDINSGVMIVGAMTELVRVEDPQCGSCGLPWADRNRNCVDLGTALGEMLAEATADPA